MVKDTPVVAPVIETPKHKTRQHSGAGEKSRQHSGAGDSVLDITLSRVDVKSKLESVVVQAAVDTKKTTAVTAVTEKTPVRVCACELMVLYTCSSNLTTG